MKAATALITLFAALATAGVIPRGDKGDKSDKELELPGCAKKCAKKFWKESECMSEDDNACLCSSSPFHAMVVPCIEEKCDKEDEMNELHAFISKTCGGMTWSQKEPMPAPMPAPAPAPAPAPMPAYVEPMPQPKTSY